jgi:hypothetical protein
VNWTQVVPLDALTEGVTPRDIEDLRDHRLSRGSPSEKGHAPTQDA